MNFPVSIPILHTDRAVLRAMRDDDLEDFKRVILQAPVRKDRDPKQALEDTRAKFEEGTSITWGIDVGGRLAGTIGFYRGFAENVAEVGYMLQADFQGKGYMQEALDAVKSHAVEVMNLRGISAYTQDPNTPSLALLERNGFVQTEEFWEDFRRWTWFPEVQPGRTVLESERLRLRCWTSQDLDLVHRMNGDPQVMRFFPKATTRAESQEFLNRAMSLQSLDGYTYFCAEMRDSGAFVGTIGLAKQRKEYPYHPCVDLGWRLLPDSWGKGLATEGAQSCLDWAWNRLQLDEVRAFCPEVNTPSESVMKRLGMQKLGTFLHPALQDYPHIQSAVAYSIKPVV